MSQRKGKFIVHRIEFDRTERGIRSMDGLSFDGGHSDVYSSYEAAEADASATARIIPGATFGIFELVAYAEEPKR
jgi:hypothetical protein